MPLLKKMGMQYIPTLAKAVALSQDDYMYVSHFRTKVTI